MKKTLTVVFALALVFALCISTVSASTIAPPAWDLEFQLRKADAAKIVKDGKIGEGEYEEIAFDKNKVFINYNHENGQDGDYEAILEKANVIKDSLKFFASWSEKDGVKYFNYAIQYYVEPRNVKNEIPFVPFETEGEGSFWDNGEFFVASKLGGIIFQAHRDVNCGKEAEKDGVNSNVIYHVLSYNTANNEFLGFAYPGQKGFTNGLDYLDSSIYGYGYDEETKLVTWECSYKLADVAAVPEVGEKAFFNINVCQGMGTGSGWALCGNKFVDVQLGQFGFYCDQLVVPVRKATTAIISAEEVGYVEPEPTPTPEPSPIVKEVEVEKAVTPVWAYIAIAVAAVAVIALVVVLVTKKK